ncbi:TIGR03915 family putative DNA repair protein [uncultured Psychroserpens sp.]|uniref:TIGR03915 family putative DNA repair protein n=1 Tax=uncultured Psychroserpens sp. TaxID=255436 RepID=UPI00263713B7|nr:TIGR03915 family putative DNA repair protein [uncultured Psychroserpens sp.]
MKEKNIIYDGSFEGFLSAVFYVFEHKFDVVNIQNNTSVQNGLFTQNETIPTETIKANRVWKGLTSKLSASACNTIYYAFLSEKLGAEQILLDYIKYAFSNTRKIDKDFSHPSVLKTSQIAKMVGREKHRMEAFVRFRLTKDAIYFASIEPDFNVLPLLIKHFKNRYADQKWIIYDIKRHYGLYYDLNTVDTINIEFPTHFDFTKTDDNYFSDQEFEFQKLWQDYFKSTNIESRKNMKLHIRHVPKRYWKYLSEKQPN